MSELPVSCRIVAEHVHELLDGELSEQQAHELRHHIDECERCLEVADLVDTLKRLVRRSCSGQEAPASLRARIVTQIHVTHVTIEGPGSAV